MRKFFLITFLCYSTCYSQWRGYESSTAGMGDAFTAVANQGMGFLYNPAGLSLAIDRHASSSYINRFQLPETHETSLSYLDPMLLPRKYGSFGIAISNFGFNIYNEMTFTIGYSILLLNRVSLGFSTSYKHIFIKNYGNTNAVFFDVGVIGIISPCFLLGFSAKQFGTLSKHLEKDIIPSFAFGASYLLSDFFQVSLDIEKDLQFPVSVRGGIAYAPINVIIFSIGAISNPLTITSGINFSHKLITINYNIAYHTTLGFSHSAGISIFFERPNQLGSHTRLFCLHKLLQHLFQVNTNLNTFPNL